MSETPLAALRKRRDLSQTDVAATLAVSQPYISHLERHVDPKLSRIESFVDALGGRLEVRVVFDDETIAL
jgi:predicted transcriptional regulator